MSNTSVLRPLLIFPLLCILGCVGFETDSVDAPPKQTDRFGERIKQLEDRPRTSKGNVYHEVGKGETLTQIARNYGSSRSEIARANNLVDENKLEIGQRLLIPTARGRSADVMANSKRSNRTGRGFVWPLDGEVLSRFNPSKNNSGIKISAAVGQKVRAAKGGVVEEVVEHANGWGKVVIIDHGDGFSTWYAHNSRIVARKGSSVKQGETSAEAGQSGRAARPQLSFRIIKGTRPVDPLQYLPRR